VGKEDQPKEPKDVPSSSNDEDEVRRAILKRRAKFIAAAVAGAGVATGLYQAFPRACLEPQPAGQVTGPVDPAGDPDMAPPRPCLSPVAYEPVNEAAQPTAETSPAAPQEQPDPATADAGAARVPAAADAAPEPGPPPHPDLSRLRREGFRIPPRPCLFMGER